MLIPQAQDGEKSGISPDQIREQLDALAQDEVFRSSKRSVQFLRYVVEQTLNGSADKIKERTVGVEVFGRDPAYDTNTDHIVRTAAIEVRKRLAIYYGQEKHRSELRMSLVPGSYIPTFSRSSTEEEAPAMGPVAVPKISEPPGLLSLAAERPRESSRHRFLWLAAAGVFVVAGLASLPWFRQPDIQDLFWKPVLDTPGAVLIAVGNVPNGPPTLSAPQEDPSNSIPVVHNPSTSTVPYADAVTMARIVGELSQHGKRVNIRKQVDSTFSELRQGPVVLVGAFNNEWSLRLTRQMRYTLALDADKHLIYIRDSRHPDSRNWSWATNQPFVPQGALGGPPLEDYALISRIWNSETGHVVVCVGGLFTYGTEAAGEFLSDSQMMQAVGSRAQLHDPHRNIQIILGTKVTDGTAGPPRVLAVSFE
jgi:hypothetical protein